MHHPMAENAHIGVLVRIDGFSAAHAFREHRIDRARELFHCGIGGSAANVHRITLGRARPIRYQLIREAVA